MRRGPGTIMTMRVSRDGGKTYGPVVVYDSVRDNLPPLMDSGWPPCTCPGHQVAADVTERQLQLELSRVALGPILRGAE
ncbi:hypothetical protein TPA0910_32020 [Streptomyces hygroscopicus subsp. sporocinereus]|uniref:Uncharacterized protein n=1 Tax=Streptomyces hygroscopicus TaxID=1912 RepID=A0ABQ3TZI2_STRHY|nr:hypothetical protein TPA0910_32020 [Streptomyces hygroscopicus]